MKITTLLAIIIAALPLHAEDQPIETFKKWFSGQIPVRYGEVEMISSLDGNTSGIILRFGSQSNSFWMEQVDFTKSKSGFPPNGSNVIAGASYDHYWRTMPGSFVDISDKQQRAMANSGNARAAVDQGTLFTIFSGQKHYDPHSATWVSDRIVTLHPRKETVELMHITSDIEIHVKSFTNGLPEHMVEMKLGKPESEMWLSYGSDLPSGIPNTIRRLTKVKGRDLKSETTIRKLDIGMIDLKSTGGYVPSMFMSNRSPAFFVNVWTNDTPYRVSDGGMIVKLNLVGHGPTSIRLTWQNIVAALVVFIAAGIALLAKIKTKGNK